MTRLYHPEMISYQEACARWPARGPFGILTYDRTQARAEGWQCDCHPFRALRRHRPCTGDGCSLCADYVSSRP